MFIKLINKRTNNQEIPKKDKILKKRHKQSNPYPVYALAQI